MKLIKSDTPYLTKSQWRKVFLAASIMTVVLYTIAIVFSLLGSKYFILNYQNTQMDSIESWFRGYHIYGLINMLFNVIEFVIVFSFILKKFPNPLYALAFYGIEVGLAFIHMPDIVYTIYPFVFYIICPIIDQAITTKKVSGKEYLKQLLRLAIAVAVVYTLQIMIYIIKSGAFKIDYIQMNLSATFIYAIEYDIALAIILFTVYLYITREKGDSKVWTTDTALGSFSQTSKKNSQKSLMKKNLTKTQRNKLRLLYLRVYLTQTLGFLLLMVLPFLLGKVFEFLVMYTAFAITRYLLGFKYSLHFKKESICITVGVIVFGILSLAVPFFTIVVIIAISLGVGLAIILHLSYKYKSMWLFNKLSRPDKFAQLYVLMDGDLTPHHVKIMCIHRGLNKEQTQIIGDFAEGNKKSYIAKKYNYSEKTIERKINEAIEILNENS